MGYGAADPVKDAWPQVLARTALPPGTTLVNLGIAGATAADALQHQLPAALAAQASVALVWLAVNDLLAQVAVDAYGRQLGHLVHALRGGGSTRVLVGNAPPLDRLPILLTWDAGPDETGGAMPSPDAIADAVDAYNEVILRITAGEGAELVDLHAATMAARAAGTDSGLVADDGFHPSTTGHRTLAATFAAVLGRAT